MALTPQQIAQFEQRLLALRKQLSRTVQQTSSEALSTEEKSGYSQHVADEGTDDFERTISMEVSGTEYQVLKQVDRALQKIKEDTYGLCDVSGQPIPLPRLEAIPYATMTVEAQDKLEKSRR